ncbi:hypothetical protein [uncultured Pseudokineococcus sp.]|uniref:hypothetical protein n=1 Tax=uncultured Pseudokineococcus sp. TaxID=1642928 RepID=UPI002619C210|nr:hypothetical protein [uncultured Pseudokineococcus sp.]
MTTPGPYRIADGSAVAFPDALDAWTPAAPKILTDRARALSTRSGIATRSLLQT